MAFGSIGNPAVNWREKMYIANCINIVYPVSDNKMQCNATRSAGRGEVILVLGDAYRARALAFEQLANRTTDKALKSRLKELAAVCVRVAEAIDRHPGIIALERLERPQWLH